MLKPRHLLILFSMTLVFVIAAIMVLNNKSQDQHAGSVLFADLLGRINTVATVNVTANGNNFKIENSELGWHIPHHDNYRADANKIHKLLVGLSALRRIEPKTLKPELYSAIGVQEPDQEGSKAVLIVLTDKAGAALLSVIIGQDRPARADPSAREYFVRLRNDPQSWLVEGALPQINPRVSDWLDKKIALIDESRLRHTRVVRPDNEVITAFKAAPETRNFSYLELPEGRQLVDEWQMNDLGKFLAALEIQDVYAKDNSPPSTPMLKVEVETFDGLKIDMQASRTREDTVLIELMASGNASMKISEPVRAEVEQLNRRWRGWVYLLPKFKADYLMKRQVDFLKKP